MKKKRDTYTKTKMDIYKQNISYQMAEKFDLQKLAEKVKK